MDNLRGLQGVRRVDRIPNAWVRKFGSRPVRRPRKIGIYSASECLEKKNKNLGYGADKENKCRGFGRGNILGLTRDSRTGKS